MSSYQNLKYGNEFTSQFSRIKLLTLLNSEHSGMVCEYGESLQTDRQMYQTYFKTTFVNNKGSEKLISVDAMTSKQLISIVKTSDDT